MAILDKSDLEALWIQAGGTEATADVASAVALAESKGDTTAIDNTQYPDRAGYHKPSPGAQVEYSIGLWQINQPAHPTYTVANLQQALGNAKAALAISSDGTDWNQWTTYVDGAYRAFLADVIGGALATGSGQPSTPGAPTFAALPPLKGFSTPPKTSPNFFNDPNATVAAVIKAQEHAVAAAVPASITGAWNTLRVALGKTVPTNVTRQKAANAAFAKIVG